MQVVLGSRGAPRRTPARRARSPAAPASSRSRRTATSSPSRDASAAAPKPAMPATVLGAGAATGFLPAAERSATNGAPARTTSAPTPGGPPSLWADEAEIVDAEAVQVDRHLAGGLHRIAMHQRAGVAGDAHDLGHRLQHAGLVVGEHHRHQRGLVEAASIALQGGEIDARRRRRPARCRPRGTARSTLSCSIAETSTRRRPAPASAMLLASVPPEVKTTSAGSAPTSAATWRRASSTSPRALRPTRCTDDGLPPVAQRLDHGVERLRPERAGGVVVEIRGRGGHRAGL